jgi:glucose-6-phosphate 1-dehydrogenase
MSGAEPALFVILGATGDLGRRKLFPAVARLTSRGALGSPSLILGVARAAGDDASFRAWARKALAAAGHPAGELAAWRDECVRYQSIGSGRAADFAALADRIRSLESAHGLPGNRVFYLALPPAAFPGTIRGLGEAGLGDGPGWTRLVVEKPFGRDLATARDLNALVHRYFDEQQVFRIDHYLAKETVQNLLVFRFSNAIFESLWNRDHVDAVEITVAEQLGVEQRAGYYDQTGALRDMVQNHATQLLTLFAMDVPTAYEEDAIRIEKLKVLRSVNGLDRADVVFGQYAAGVVAGRPVPGYRDEPGVAPGSRTETFAALKVQVDNWRWQGVPFYIRSGKRLAQRLTQIEVAFRRPPVAMFRSAGDAGLRSNRLLITLQPQEGFSLFFDVKAPGEPLRLCALPLRFDYGEAFGPLPDAYETLITEILAGVRTHFVDGAWVEESWRVYTPLLDGTQPVLPYAAGSWGPPEANRLSLGHLGESGRHFLGPHSILPPAATRGARAQDEPAVAPMAGHRGDRDGTGKADVTPR